MVLSTLVLRFTAWPTPSHRLDTVSRINIVIPIKKLNSVALVRERTIPTERPIVTLMNILINGEVVVVQNDCMAHKNQCIIQLQEILLIMKPMITWGTNDLHIVQQSPFR
jgi:hypothetical protein